MRRACIVYKNWDSQEEKELLFDTPIRYFLVGFYASDGIPMAILESPTTRELVFSRIEFIKMTD